MKTVLKIRKGVGLLSAFVLTFSLTQNVSAQIPAGTSENSWAGYAGVQNTGNAVSDFLGTGDDIGVTVWDGADPGIGWDMPGGSGSLTLDPNLTDPDVTISQSGKFITVVYEKGGNIFIESYTPSSSSAIVNIGGPIMISAGTGTASYPNIDGFRDRAVVVWSEKNNGSIEIFTRHIEAATISSLFPIVNITAPFVGSSTNSMEPDVSVYRLPGLITYNYTYINQTGTTLDVIYQVEEAVAIAAGSTSTIHYDPFINLHISDAPSKPRIASHFRTGVSPIDASAIVFGIPSSKAVLSYSNSAGLHKLANGASPSLGSCDNRNPAICWSSATHQYVTGWMIQGSCTSPSTFGIDIISVKLDDSGTPITSSSFGYQWVNDYNTGTQKALSLSSRYSANGQIFSSFSSQNLNVLYKFTNAASLQYFRGDNTTTAIETLETKSVLNLYPNPVNEVLSVESTDITSVVLYSLTGQVVRSFGAADLGQDVLKIPVADLSSGIYMLKAEGNGKTFTEKITIK